MNEKGAEVIQRRLYRSYLNSLGSGGPHHGPGPQRYGRPLALVCTENVVVDACWHGMSPRTLISQIILL